MLDPQNHDVADVVSNAVQDAVGPTTRRPAMRCTARVGGRKTYLFAFIEEHSRALVGYRWGHSEDTVRLEAALPAGLAARGVPLRAGRSNGC